MTLRESFVKGMLRQKCIVAQNQMFDLGNSLSESPENIAILEDLEAVLQGLAKLMERFN